MEKRRFTWIDPMLPVTEDRFITHCNQFFALLLVLIAKNLKKKDFKTLPGNELNTYKIYYKNLIPKVELSKEKSKFIGFSNDEFNNISNMIIEEKPIEISIKVKEIIYNYFISIVKDKFSIEIYALYILKFIFLSAMMFSIIFCVLKLIIGGGADYNSNSLLWLGPILFFCTFLFTYIQATKYLSLKQGTSKNVLDNLEHHISLRDVLIEIDEVFEKLTKEYEKISVEKKKTKKEEEYLTLSEKNKEETLKEFKAGGKKIVNQKKDISGLSRDELLKVFYTEHKEAPRDLFDILRKIERKKGEPILLEDYSFNKKSSVSIATFAGYIRSVSNNGKLNNKLLLALCPHNSDYSKAKGMSEKKLDDFSNAIKRYSLKNTKK